MRRILFRGKRIDNGEWVEGGSIIRFDPESNQELVFMPHKHEGCTACHDDEDNITGFESGMFYKVDPDTVGQYTGLEDRNGKMIFEGDIVRCESGRVCKVIYFTSPGFAQFDLIPVAHFEFPIPHLWNLFAHSEVIGNIHDDQELMGGETDD